MHEKNICVYIYICMKNKREGAKKQQQTSGAITTDILSALKDYARKCMHKGRD